MKVSIVAAFISALTLFSTNSYASIIATGIPVDENGNAVALGNVNANGTIKFYIPLSGGDVNNVPIYGVNGAGLTGGGFINDGNAGLLDMFLSFSPTYGGDTLAFYFKDLDLIGVNDPFGFLESIAVYNQDMSTQIAYIDSASDPEVIQISTNNYHQRLLVSLASVMPLGDPFIAKLRFSAGPVTGYNTPEKIKVTLVGIQVPEPASYMTFAIGLLCLGVISLRRSGYRFRYSAAVTQT